MELRCFLFLQEIGRVEFGTGGGALRFAPRVVHSGKESFEGSPSFLLCRYTFTGFAVIGEETSLIENLEGDTNDLFEAIGTVIVGVVVTTIFDPVEKGFNRLVYIIRGAKYSVVFLQIRVGYVGIGGVQLIQDGRGGGEAISNVLVLEGVDAHFVNSREKNLSERLVGAIVLVEECGGCVKSIAKYVDLGASGVGWDDGYISGVEGHDEGDGRKGVVDGR